MRKISRANDIIVNFGIDRHVGLSGRVLSSDHFGVSAVMENGERLKLKNQQFDYISENSENSSSHYKKKV